MNWDKPIVSRGHRIMYEAPARMINGSKSNVIDIGCSNGYGYYRLIEENAVSRYLGLDLHKGGIAELNEIIQDKSNHKAIIADWLELSDNELFVADYILCVEVLEHIKVEDRKRFLEKCAKYVKMNMFLSTPPRHHTRIHHYGLLQTDECVDLLTSAGFMVVPMEAQWTTLYMCAPIV